MSQENVCKVEVFSRVTGFFRPVQSWNMGKTAEFKDRKRYELDTFCDHKDEKEIAFEQAAIRG